MEQIKEINIKLKSYIQKYVYKILKIKINKKL